jgi:hypothetical protein
MIMAPPIGTPDEHPSQRGNPATDGPDELASLKTANLDEFLKMFTSRLSDAQLVLTAIAGVLGAAATLITRVSGWPVLTAVSVAVLAFGVWGILGRELTDHPGRRPIIDLTLRALRTLIVIAGAASAAFVLLAIVSIAFGTWIS